MWGALQLLMTSDWIISITECFLTEIIWSQVAQVLIYEGINMVLIIIANYQAQVLSSRAVVIQQLYSGL